MAARISVLILLASLVGCDRQGAEPATVRIGVLVHITSSEGLVEAAKLAVRQVNDAGGLHIGGHRRHVELFFEDTKASPDEAVDGARRLIQRDVIGILGPGRSREAIAVAGLLENLRIPMISATSTHPETTAGRRYAFRVSFTDTFQGEEIGRFAFEELGANSAAVLYDIASTYNRNLATVFQQAFEAAGGKVVAVETYTTGESDLKPQLRRIRDVGPRVLFLPNYSEDVPTQARQVRELGIDATLLGGDSWTLLPFDLPQLQGALFGQHFFTDEAESTPGGLFLTAAFRQVTGHDPPNEAALAYDAMGLLFRAIEIAGIDPEDIRQALAGIEAYQGVTGAITYRGNDGDPPRPLVMMQIRQGKAHLYKEIGP